MSLGKAGLFLGLGSLVLLARLVVAGETTPAGHADQGGVAEAEKDAKPAAGGESVEQLIEQLDSAEYDKREAACGKLAAKGKAAIAALENASANGNLEVSSRATTLLGKLLKSSDAATADAASSALKRLANGDSAAAARKAKSILDEKIGSKDAPGMNAGGGIVFGNGGGRIVINGGQLNFGGGALRTMSVKTVNGVKEINASEDGKTVKIQDDPAKGIKVELTEKENGKEVTKKYDAKNADELKKNHPSAYEIYKKYGAEQPANGVLQGVIQLQIGNVPIPGNGLPAVPLQPAAPLLGRPMVPATAPGGAAQQEKNLQVTMATRKIKSLSSQLERLQKAEACKDASPESKAELKKQISELSKQMEALRGQLGDK